MINIEKHLNSEDIEHSMVETIYNFLLDYFGEITWKEVYINKKATKEEKIQAVNKLKEIVANMSSETKKDFLEQVFTEKIKKQTMENTQNIEVDLENYFNF
ncbi:hypothetical protein H6790_00260 [Candidatus Nomurabacteria bacterium]|nr:hypothetical protein [Candidatus Nomurabacteria bacterium]MCB9820368.1 hypothetical protein [Candidatus Nomurabacteria bacterium]